MCSSCGSFHQYCTHQGGSGCGSFSSMGWPNNTQYQSYDDRDYSVDCTLSLGTPSTRFSTSDCHTNYYDHNTSSSNSCNKSTSHRNSVSSSWDLLHPTKHSSSSSKSHRHSSSTATADPLLARRCANCDTTSTPLWRNGPRGPKSLCNACGIRYKKEERRAAAASTSAAHNAGMMIMEPHSGSWGHQYPQATPQKMAQMQCFGAQDEFRFIEDDCVSDGGVQFLSWLTYDSSSGLVHDFTH